jgi:hypothetical protein
MDNKGNPIPNPFAPSESNVPIEGATTVQWSDRNDHNVFLLADTGSYTVTLDDVSTIPPGVVHKLTFVFEAEWSNELITFSSPNNLNNKSGLTSWVFGTVDSVYQGTSGRCMELFGTRAGLFTKSSQLNTYFRSTDTAVTTVNPDDGDGNTAQTVNLNIPTTFSGSPVGYTRTNNTTVRIDLYGWYNFRTHANVTQQPNAKDGIGVQFSFAKNGTVIDAAAQGGETQLSYVENIGTLTYFIAYDSGWFWGAPNDLITLPMLYPSYNVPSGTTDYVTTVEHFEAIGYV